MLRKLIFFISTLFIIPVNIFPAMPVEIHGAMKTSGNKITGSNDDKPFQVAGMSLYWTKWGGEKFYNTQAVDWLVTDWKITLIRCAMGVESNGLTDTDKGYLDTPQRQINFVKTVVDAAIDKGIYVIIDWHDHNANLHIEAAKQFFGELASIYKNTPNVIWEIWNEPDGVSGTGMMNRDSWDDIKGYADQIIPVIREHSSNLIVVGTPLWCQDVMAAANDPLSDDNVAYTLHFYAGTHGKALRDSAQKALDKNIALFITEFGLTDASGGNKDPNLYYDSTTAWLDWADTNGLSWANWSIVDKTEKSAALVPGSSENGNWPENKISESGKWIRNRIHSRPETDTSSNIKEKDTLTIPGRLEAESYVTKSDTSVLKAEQTLDEDGGENIGYTKTGCWAEYVIRVNSAGKYKIKARVASDLQGGTITVKIGTVNATSLSVGNTGGWQSWKTTAQSDAFELPSGICKVRLEWSGSEESLINLNWIEFEKATSIRKQTINDHHRPRITVLTGFLLFKATDEFRSISLLSPSGRLLHKSTVKNELVKLQTNKGLNLLLLEKKSGIVNTIKVMGQ